MSSDRTLVFKDGSKIKVEETVAIRIPLLKDKSGEYSIPDGVGTKAYYENIINSIVEKNLPSLFETLNESANPITLCKAVKYLGLDTKFKKTEKVLRATIMQTVNENNEMFDEKKKQSESALVEYIIGIGLDKYNYNYEDGTTNRLIFETACFVVDHPATFESLIRKHAIKIIKQKCCLIDKQVARLSKQVSKLNHNHHYDDVSYDDL